jgi:hypothetical protein
LLRQHRELAAPSRKELHFFDDETRDWSTPDYDAIEPWFQASGPGLRFDITPIYCYWPQSMERIQRYDPSARLIILFRDPFHRAWSHWCMQYARGLERLTFAEALHMEPERMGAPHQAQERRFFSYVDRGRYGSQMRRLLTLFPREQILALCAEDLRQDQAGTLKRVAAFLDIGLFPSLLPAREHRRPDITYPKMPGADERALVYAMLRHEMEELAGLTDGQIHYVE